MGKLLMFLTGVLFIVTGCAHQQKYRIGFLHPSNDRMRFVKETGFFKEKVAELGAEAIVVDADDNESLQLERGYQMLEDDNIDMLIIAAVNGNTIAPLVRKAKGKGIPVIAYNMLINNVDYDIFFSGDNNYLAKLFCETAVKTHPTGNYVIIGGDRFDRNGVELKQGIDSLLRPHVERGEINVVYNTYVEGWNRESAAYEFDQILQSYGKNIDVVLACNDLMADGVIRVLDKNKMDHSVFISGQDADIIGVRNVYRGKQSMTVYHPAKAYGYGVADLAISILKGENPKKLANSSVYNGFGRIPNFRIKSVLITSDNIGKDLVDAGECSWDDVRKE